MIWGACSTSWPWKEGRDLEAVSLDQGLQTAFEDMAVCSDKALFTKTAGGVQPEAGVAGLPRVAESLRRVPGNPLLWVLGRELAFCYRRGTGNSSSPRMGHFVDS